MKTPLPQLILLMLAPSITLSCTQTIISHESGIIQSDKLTEISGLAASYNFPGQWWIHNDGGQNAEIYLVSETGKILNIVEIAAATNHDWEDMARFQYQQRSWLVIGDVGDNNEKRPSIQLYLMPEPDNAVNRVTNAQTIQLTYPDGPRDCESIAVDPVGEFIYLLSKRDHPARLYRIPLQQAFNTVAATLEFVGEVVSIPAHTKADIKADPERGKWSDQATAMDISADGSLITLQTYKMAMLFNRNTGESVLDTLNGKARTVNTHPLVQEEAIAFSLDGKHMLITTEQQPAPILRVDLGEL